MDFKSSGVPGQALKKAQARGLGMLYLWKFASKIYSSLSSANVGGRQHGKTSVMFEDYKTLSLLAALALELKNHSKGTGEKTSGSLLGFFGQIAFARKGSWGRVT